MNYYHGIGLGKIAEIARVVVMICKTGGFHHKNRRKKLKECIAASLAGRDESMMILVTPPGTQMQVAATPVRIVRKSQLHRCALGGMTLRANGRYCGQVQISDPCEPPMTPGESDSLLVC